MIDLAIAVLNLAVLAYFAGRAVVWAYRHATDAWRRRGTGSEIFISSKLTEERNNEGQIIAYIIKGYADVIPGEHIRNVNKALKSVGISQPIDDGKE